MCQSHFITLTCADRENSLVIVAIEHITSFKEILCDSDSKYAKANAHSFVFVTNDSQPFVVQETIETIIDEVRRDNNAIVYPQ